MTASKEEIKQRIAHVQANNGLTLDCLSVRWGIKPCTVRRFLKQHGLTKLPPNHAYSIYDDVCYKHKPKTRINRKEMIKKRIEFVMENKSHLTVQKLAERWGIKDRAVHRFIKKHNLPKLMLRAPKLNKNTQKVITNERIAYIKANHKEITITLLAERWGVEPVTVWSFIKRHQLPKVAATKNALLKIKEKERTQSLSYTSRITKPILLVGEVQQCKGFMGQYRNIHDAAARIRLI